VADNTLLNLGSGGDTIASDDIGPGVKYPRVKITLGADGVNNGDVASGNPMPSNVTQVGGTATDTNSGTKSAGTLRVVLATDQPQLTNKLLVTPDANSAVNVAQFGAANVATGTGAGGAGIPRVTISNDSSLAANQSVNVAQMNGVATSMGIGVSDTGTQRVVQAYDGAVTLQGSQTSGVANATTTRTTTTGLGIYCEALILINVTGGGVATGTLQLYLEDSVDGGTTWHDLVSSNTFTFGAATTTQLFAVSGRLATSLTQGAAATVETLAAGTVRQGPFGDRIRVREKVSGIGGSPTGVTYTISGVFTR
jgi:hypothetical protein